MFNSEEFLNNFIEAAKNDDEETMIKLADSIAEEPMDFRVNLLTDLVQALRDSQANPTVEAVLAAALELMRLAQQAVNAEKEKEDSAVEEAKEDTKAKEATQDVAAVDSAEEAEGDSAQVTDAATETEAES